MLLGPSGCDESNEAHLYVIENRVTLGVMFMDQRVTEKKEGVYMGKGLGNN